MLLGYLSEERLLVEGSPALVIAELRHTVRSLPPLPNTATRLES